MPQSAAAPSVAASSIRVGDTLDVQVAGEPGLSKSYLVDAAGQITLDLVGTLVVTGRTTDQVVEELGRRLSRFLKLPPTVTVTASTPQRNEVIVTGEVVRPGTVKLRAGDTLLDALASVGGLGPNADVPRASLVRRGQMQPQPLMEEALLKGDLSHNMALVVGDIIQVPKREPASFQVMGEVKQPGTRLINGTATVLDAILAAGGLTERADRSQVTLTRRGQTEAIQIDLEQVLAGGNGANHALQAGDVLSVGSRMPIQVVGEVRTPGERLLRHGGTLMEAVLRPGRGPSRDPGDAPGCHVGDLQPAGGDGRRGWPVAAAG
jgi:protein involved in polysaccharide export with SLBB domain